MVSLNDHAELAQAALRRLEKLKESL